MLSEKSFSFPVPNDLNMYYCGKRSDKLDHQFGPDVRNHFLITFVKEGQATLTNKGRQYRIQPNHLLVMFPGKAIHYEADKGKLWSIKWIGVGGKLVYHYMAMLGITEEYPLYEVAHHEELESVLDEIYGLSTNISIGDKIECMALVQKFFAVLYKDSFVPSTQNRYIRDALKYIVSSYEKSITVDDMAAAVNLNRNYFTKLFRDELGVPPALWLSELRFRRACYMLENSNMSVGDVAAAVGIPDQLYFSRFFKKKSGITPSAYRKAHTG